MCRECLNVVQFTSLVTETRQHIIDRSPNAFAPKVAYYFMPEAKTVLRLSRALKDALERCIAERLTASFLFAGVC